MGTYAYIDPSTTTYIVQILAGVVVVGGMAFGIFWHKIKRLFKKNKADEAIAKEGNDDYSDENLAD